MTQNNTALTAQAHRLVKDWTHKHIAHGGAIDALEVADSDQDGAALLQEAIETEAPNIAAFLDENGEEGKTALLFAFEEFVESCVEEANTQT